MIHYQITPSLRLIEIIVTGVVSYQAVIDFHKQVVNDAHFSPELDLLVDLQDMTTFEINSNEIRVIIASTPFAAGNKRALVTGERPLSFGTSRMYSSLSERRFQNLRLFKQRSEALEWLKAPTNEEDRQAPSSSA